nr:hypothetical protein [Vibrio metschnikovii]
MVTVLCGELVVALAAP